MRLVLFHLHPALSCTQVLLTLLLIAVQVSINVVWLILEPPDVYLSTSPDKPEPVIVKCQLRNYSFLLSLFYNMLLVITCTVYAVKTRKIPENFNESKFIGFTMYTTCVIWLAFIPLYYGTLHSLQVCQLAGTTKNCSIDYCNCNTAVKISYGVCVYRFRWRHCVYQWVWVRMWHWPVSSCPRCTSSSYIQRRMCANSLSTYPALSRHPQDKALFSRALLLPRLITALPAAQMVRIAHHCCWHVLWLAISLSRCKVYTYSKS